MNRRQEPEQHRHRDQRQRLGHGAKTWLVKPGDPLPWWAWTGRLTREGCQAVLDGNRR